MTMGEPVPGGTAQNPVLLSRCEFDYRVILSGSIRSMEMSGYVPDNMCFDYHVGNIVCRACHGG